VVLQLDYHSAFMPWILNSASPALPGYLGLMYHILQKYVAESARHLMERSVQSSLLFGVMPAINYLFDYSATVYTDFMYSGTRAAVQFMPFVTSAFYFMFVLLYYAETHK